MPAQFLNGWNPLALTSAHQALVAYIDGAGAGKITLHDASDVTLATVPLNMPCGAVNVATGKLTLSFAGVDTSADATGIANYATLRTGSNVAICSLPCAEGASAIQGVCVLSNLNILFGGVVEVLSMEIG